MKLLFIITGILSCAAFALGEPVWTQDLIVWGQGTTTNQAANAAYQASLPQINNLRLKCDTSKGIVGIQSSYGYCTKNTDPMFCSTGCYICPEYVTAGCTVDTSGKILPGSLVVATANGDLYTGNQKVGTVTQGTQFHVQDIQGSWASLQAMDGTTPPGWLLLTDLKLVS